MTGTLHISMTFMALYQTSVIKHLPMRLLTVWQDQYDAAFAAFQQNFHYDPSTFMAQPQGLKANSDSPHIRPNRPDSVMSMPEIDPNSLQPSTADMSPDEPVPAGSNARSSSEEKDTMTPQQSRRKAQNRAA